MTTTEQQINRLTDEALAFWRSEGAGTAADADIAAFLDDATALGREQAARDWRRDPMITRATVPLPAGLVGFRLFDGETGQAIGSHYRSAPIHPRLDCHSVVNALTNRNTLARILCQHQVGAWREQPLERLEVRTPEFPGLLDIAVFGGVAHPAAAPA